MSQAFIIMQIGNPELERVCKEAIVPALKACGLDPKRVDKHNEGGLLKSEIIAFIQGSDIIVADLTNERPNCYLEVGYAMGVDKFRNLILTAREDHNQDSAKHMPSGPKVHFDLSGYDILFWDPKHLDDFRTELEKRIRRRQTILAPAVGGAQSKWDEEWLVHHRGKANAGLGKTGKNGLMEVSFTLLGSKPNSTPKELYEAAEKSQIHTFGWPIGVVPDRNSKYRAYPTAEGVICEILPEDQHSYDYWVLKRNGDFYLLKNLFEDEQVGPRRIFFNTRIVRVTEVLLYCARLYSNLNILPTATVCIGIRHVGLRGRILAAAGGERLLFRKRSTIENEVYSEISAPLSQIESNLVELVKKFTQPLFVVFDFFEVEDKVYEDIINKFVEGKVA